MNSHNDFFNDDPWGGINGPCYPEGRRLYLNDDRFWVSINDDGQLLFFVHETGAENVKGLQNLAGVEIKVEKFENDEYRLICALTTNDPDLKEKFSIVAKDVAYHCSKFSGAQLFLKVQERIKSWANFLKPKRNGLSHSEFVGLWGELYVVSEILMKVHTPSDTVRFWIGPEGKKQDITLNTIAVEVKTSISGDPRTIKISSIDQLDRVTDELYLLHIIANPSSDEQGLSLSSLYDKCLRLIGHDFGSETLFLQKTSELYGEASEAQLNDKYSIVSLSMFRVSDGFPCITRDDVGPGISKVNYEIYVSSIKKFEITNSINGVIENG